MCCGAARTYVRFASSSGGARSPTPPYGYYGRKRALGSLFLERYRSNFTPNLKVGRKKQSGSDMLGVNGPQARGGDPLY